MSRDKDSRKGPHLRTHTDFSGFRLLGYPRKPGQVWPGGVATAGTAPRRVRGRCRAFSAPIRHRVLPDPRLKETPARSEPVWPEDAAELVRGPQLTVLNSGKPLGQRVWALSSALVSLSLFFKTPHISTIMACQKLIAHVSVVYFWALCYVSLIYAHSTIWITGTL